jgi:hypothetical protein
VSHKSIVVNHYCVVAAHGEVGRDSVNSDVHFGGSEKARIICRLLNHEPHGDERHVAAPGRENGLNDSLAVTALGNTASTSDEHIVRAELARGRHRHVFTLNVKCSKSESIRVVRQLFGRRSTTQSFVRVLK